ncbi:hypothetical protein M0R45_003058 [Rubus argutus]|uniref:Uncharacterized protein n=1 Tax=Rubus argutus TaxID=59490 RepID=A0AAW1YHF3_RUBAR
MALQGRRIFMGGGAHGVDHAVCVDHEEGRPVEVHGVREEVHGDPEEEEDHGHGEEEEDHGHVEEEARGAPDLEVVGGRGRGRAVVDGLAFYNISNDLDQFRLYVVINYQVNYIGGFLVA